MLQSSTLQFYRELRLNNHKDWFDQNRSRYELVKKDYQKLVGEILVKMQKFDPTLGHLQVKDCTFRINRDIRFSKDKTPYKTHNGIILSTYGRKLEYAGYYIHIDEEAGSFAGGGIYMPSAEVLKKLRREVSVFYEDLEQIVKSPGFKKTYNDLDRDEGMVLSRPPKGYSENDPALEYLKLKSYTATSQLSTKLLTDPKGVDKVVEVLKEIKPLLDFLNRGLRDGM